MDGSWIAALVRATWAAPCIALVACPQIPGEDAGPVDTGAVDAGVVDTGGVDHGGADAAGDAGTRDTVNPACDQIDGGHLDERGFCIRVPRTHSVPVDWGQPGETTELPERDHVCTLRHDTVDGFLYVRGDPVECQEAAGCLYSTAGIWLSSDGQVTPIVGAYDLGGRHVNDFIDAEYGGLHFRLTHSSLGYGFRACQPPDCLQVFESDGVTLIENGCTPERTLPQVCVMVDEDGVVPPLVDTFDPCPGDPNVDAG